MKQDTKNTLYVAAAAAGLLALLRYKGKQADGVGKIHEKPMYYSKYQISWIILIPNSGIATKHDESVLSKWPFWFRRLGKVALGSHRPSRKAAELTLSKLMNSGLSLDKSYTAYIISDAQFGMIDARNGWTTEAVMDVITTMQADKSEFISSNI